MSPVSRSRKKKRRVPPPGVGTRLPPLPPPPPLPPGARYTLDDLGPAQHVIHRELTGRGWRLDTRGGDHGPAWFYPPSVPPDWNPDDPRWDEARAVPLTPTRLTEDVDRTPRIERAGPVRTGPLTEWHSYADLTAVLARAGEIESWRATEPQPPPEWPTPPGGWPDWLWTVPYLGSAHPGADHPPPVERGANCQRYAYEILALFGRRPPPLRSSELWADTAHTTPVDGAPQPLDLLLFNATPDAQPQAHGAHVGVWMCDGQVLHLSAEVGVPAVWTLDTFRATDRYAVLVGAKRVITRPAAPAGS